MKTPIDKNKSISRLVIILIALILGLAFGALLLFLVRTYQQQAEGSQANNIGVITPDRVAALEEESLEEREYGLINVFYDSELMIEPQIIEQLLNSEELGIFTESGTGDISIYIIPSITADQLASDNQQRQFSRFDGAIVSGNYVYLTEEFTRAIARPVNSYQSLFAGLMYAELFNQLDQQFLNQLSESENNYDFSNNETVSSFASLTDSDVADWQTPYPSKVKEYEVYVSVCSSVDSAVDLLICELAVYQASENDKLPPNSQEFIANNFDLRTNAQYKATGVIEGGEIKTSLEELNYEEADLRFNAWDVPNFTSDAYQLREDDIFYSELSSQRLQRLRSEIEADGWQLQLETDPVEDDQFGFDTVRYIYEKENNLLKSQLTLMVMDTSTLNVDCIIEGIGEVFCDNKESINKDSGYYVQVIVGQFARYELDE
jgi:hypothetical protein